jgi:KRAB domain-containing zinc finger protein
VVDDDELPNGLCSVCSGSTVDAANFTILCRQAHYRWTTTLQLLENLPPPKTVKLSKAIYAIISDDQMTIIDDCKSMKADKPNQANVNEELKSLKSKRKSYPICLCQCPTCGKCFQYASRLSLHLKESCDLQRACHICAQVMSRDDLISHMAEHDIKPYPCEKCPALFHNETNYIKHHEKAHKSGACTCGECGRTFQSRFGLQAHQSLHTKKNCPSCDKLFRNQSCYIYHLKDCCGLNKNRKDLRRTNSRLTVEVRNKTSKKKIRVGLRGRADNECICDYCGKIFQSRKFISAHIQHVHMKNTHRPCPYCGKSLAAAHMTEHIKTHELVRSYKCDHCNLVLKTRLGFIQHLRLHTGEKPYACKECGETFSASSRRSEHIKRFHFTGTVNKHVCDICPARFMLPSQLRKHKEAVHSQTSPNVVFECNECHEKFSSCRGLIHHSRKHQKDIDLSQIPRRTYVKLKENYLKKTNNIQ